MSLIARKFNQLVWDYRLTPAEFESILFGKTSRGTFTQSWAITRVLENLNYYDAISLVPPSLLQTKWSEIRPKLFQPAIIKGYEFLLHRYSLSTPGQSS